MRYPPPLPFAPAPRPIKRETIAVWRAVVSLRKAELAPNDDGKLEGPLHKVHRLSRRTHVVDGRQVTTHELMKRARAAQCKNQTRG